MALSVDMAPRVNAVGQASLGARLDWLDMKLVAKLRAYDVGQRLAGEIPAHVAKHQI
jgi:hypothetical protein